MSGFSRKSARDESNPARARDAQRAAGGSALRLSTRILNVEFGSKKIASRKGDKNTLYVMAGVTRVESGAGDAIVPKRGIVVAPRERNNPTEH